MMDSISTIIAKYYHNPNPFVSATIASRVKSSIDKKRERVDPELLFMTQKNGLELFNYLTELGYEKGVHHVDHIIPRGVFDMTNINHRRVCFNYRNLQPLLPIENTKKRQILPDNWEEIVSNICDNIGIDHVDIVYDIDKYSRSNCNRYHNKNK